MSRGTVLTAIRQYTYLAVRLVRMTYLLMKVLTVSSYKGGVGKSACAIHLASFFSERGKTLLIDSDPNRTSLKRSERGKGQLSFEVVDERESFKVIAGRDYLLIDTPARPHTDDLKSLAKGCDLLIIPTTPDIDSLEPMLQTAHDLPAGVQYRCLLNICPPPPHKDAQQMRRDLQAAGLPLFHTSIRRSVSFSKAAFLGCTVRELKGRNRLPWLDYEQLGREILELWNQPESSMTSTA